MDLRRFVVIIIIVLAHAAPVLAGNDAAPFVFPAGTAIKISGYGVDRSSGTDMSQCDNYRLNEKQIRAFFEHAVVIGGNKVPPDYYTSPCYAEGECNTSNIRFTWKLDWALTCRVKTAGGRTFFLGCGDGCTKEVCRLQDDHGEEDLTPMWNTYLCFYQTTKNWAEADRDKRPYAALYRSVQERLLKRDTGSYMAAEAAAIGVTGLAKAGLPGLDEWKRISGGTEYTRFNIIGLRHRQVVVADTGGNEGGGKQDFYVMESGNWRRILHLDFCYLDFYSIGYAAGKYEFIEMRTTYGGSGSRTDLYSISDRNELKEAAGGEGWRARFNIFNLSGKFTIVSSCAEETNAWRDEVKKCPGFGCGAFGGPQLVKCRVFQLEEGVIRDKGFFYIGDREITQEY